jgi:hypothetical protein
MHPEVVSDNPGKCPKCGMALVLRTEVQLNVHQTEAQGLGVLTWKSYMPLFVIFGVLLLTAVFLCVRDNQLGVASIEKFISYFMIGFFLTFSTFKIMDLKGFSLS